jgi:hypothetical protein
VNKVNDFDEIFSGYQPRQVCVVIIIKELMMMTQMVFETSVQ